MALGAAFEYYNTYKQHNLPFLDLSWCCRYLDPRASSTLVYFENSVEKVASKLGSSSSPSSSSFSTLAKL